ncbi:MAG: DUF6452 family protein [Bacteroidaceae bacterium]
MIKLIKYALSTAMLLFSLTACNDTDCTLKNTVYATFGIYNSKTGLSIKLSDTLTVTAIGTDSILLNKATGIATIDLPMSYAQTTDTLLFHFNMKNGNATDTILITHTNEPYFESADCGTAMFHNVNKVEWKKQKTTQIRSMTLDSITITNKKINYEQTENFKLYISNH